MEPIKTFWVEPSGRVQIRLRIYQMGSVTPCTSAIHDAKNVTDIEIDARLGDEGRTLALIPPEEFEGNPLWPTECKHCGHPYDESWIRHVEQEPWYVDGDGNRWPADELPPGAMYDAFWMSDWWRGPDGIALQVMLPNGHAWAVDAEANNCTRRGDRAHQCWVRHGDPKTEPVTVGKDGETCDAGAGSILSGDFHGFLRNGYLIEA